MDREHYTVIRVLQAEHETSLMCAGEQGKTNFFERRVGEYQRAGVMQPNRSGAEHKHSHVFTTDDDF